MYINYSLKGFCDQIFVEVIGFQIFLAARISILAPGSI